MTQDAINVGLSILGTGLVVGGIIWGLERRKERNDINNIGGEINKTRVELVETRGEIAAIRLAQAEDRLTQAEDRLTYTKLLNDSETKIQKQLNDIQVTLGRLDERFDVVALLKAVVHEDRK